MDENNRDIDFNLPFVKRGQEVVKLTRNAPGFKRDDGRMIVQNLLSLKQVAYNDRLKSYCLLNGLGGNVNYNIEGLNFDEIDEKCQKAIQIAIQDSFKKTETPCSFEPNSTKLSQFVKNLLKQVSISRESSFQVAIALGIPVKAASSFLKDVLGKRDFFLLNHIEAIFWYCIKNDLSFSDVLRLINIYDSSPGTYNGTKVSEEKFEAACMQAEDEQSFMKLLLTLKGGPARDSNETAHREYIKLLRKCQEAIADDYNRDNEWQGKEASWRPEDITAADVENALCEGMPFDNGNLKKYSRSKLFKIVDFKRPSRGRVAEVLSRKSEVDRTDLIILSLYVANEDCKKDEYMPVKVSFNEFVRNTNGILDKCHMGKLNSGNPFDCCIILCMSSEGPLSTYAKVWEAAFMDEAAE
ncbi:MAG: hypothetical protein LBC41_16235 [Clostridiales bacterium]|jgi:hypothetical protein|nr:hypothetical protein [Clostridiales bacterium]